MNDITRCPSHELLVSYLYDECEPAERESFAAHLALCASCAKEVQGLGDARIHLASWSPPALPLGFQLTRAESEQPATVLRPTAWWKQPLPAWAQAAAAVVIFAAGMSAGAVRSGDTAGESRAVASDRPAAVAMPTTVSTVSRADFARLEARLRAMESARTDSVSLSRASAGRVDERELLARVSALMDARAVQSEGENIQRLAGVGRTLESFRAELSARLEQIEADQEDMRVALTRNLRPYQVLASINGGQ